MNLMKPPSQRIMNQPPPSYSQFARQQPLQPLNPISPYSHTYNSSYPQVYDSSLQSTTITSNNPPPPFYNPYDSSSSSTSSPLSLPVVPRSSLGHFITNERVNSPPPPPYTLVKNDRRPISDNTASSTK